MRQFARAVVLAVLIGVAVAIGAYLTAPKDDIVYPPQPVGVVPAGIVTPVAPDYPAICGLDCQVK